MRIRNGFDSLFWSGLKTGAENYIFWSEIGGGFEEQGCTPLPRILRSTPPPPAGIVLKTDVPSGPPGDYNVKLFR